VHRTGQATQLSRERDHHGEHPTSGFDREYCSSPAVHQLLPSCRYITHLARAYEREQSDAAKDAIAQILTNSRMCAEGKRPICQDTGIVNVFLVVGMNVRWQDFSGSLEDAVNEGVRRGYTILKTSCALRWSIRPSSAVVIRATTPGGRAHDPGTGRQGRSDGRRQRWRLGKQVQVRHAQSFRLDRRLGAEDRTDDGRRLVPPGMLGIGIGGTAEKAMLMAKEALMEEIDMTNLLARGPQTDAEKLRVELYEKVNALGIGAQGLGGLTTVLDIKIRCIRRTPPANRSR